MPPAVPERIELLARALVRRGGDVLLCRNLKHGYLYLPGGHVEPGESSPEACERELMEETGLSFRSGRCLLAAELRFTQRGTPRHEVSLVFHVEHSPGPLPDPVPSREPAIAFQWLPLDAPDADIRPRVIRDWLRSDPAPDAPLTWLSASE